MTTGHSVYYRQWTDPRTGTRQCLSRFTWCTSRVCMLFCFLIRSFWVAGYIFLFCIGFVHTKCQDPSTLHAAFFLAFLLFSSSRSNHRSLCLRPTPGLPARDAPGKPAMLWPPPSNLPIHGLNRGVVCVNRHLVPLSTPSALHQECESRQVSRACRRGQGKASLRPLTGLLKIIDKKQSNRRKSI